MHRQTTKSHSSYRRVDFFSSRSLLLANETGKQNKQANKATKHLQQQATPGGIQPLPTMTIHSCLKTLSKDNSTESRVLRSAEITQCLMLPQEQLQERLQSELTGAQQPTPEGAPAPSMNTAMTPSKVAIVTGLELLNLYSGEQEGSVTASGDTEEDSLDSYCANSLKLAHEHLEGATDHVVTTSRRRLIHKIAEEEEEDELLQQEVDASFGSSSNSEDDFDDFCNDSFSRGLATRKQSVDGSRTAIPNLDTYSCLGGMGRAA